MTSVSALEALPFARIRSDLPKRDLRVLRILAELYTQLNRKPSSRVIKWAVARLDSEDREALYLAVHERIQTALPNSQGTVYSGEVEGETGNQPLYKRGQSALENENVSIEIKQTAIVQFALQENLIIAEKKQLNPAPEPASQTFVQKKTPLNEIQRSLFDHLNRWYNDLKTNKLAFNIWCDIDCTLSDEEKTGFYTYMYKICIAHTIDLGEGERNRLGSTAFINDQIPACYKQKAMVAFAHSQGLTKDEIPDLEDHFLAGQKLIEQQRASSKLTPPLPKGRGFLRQSVRD